MVVSGVHAWRLALRAEYYTVTWSSVQGRLQNKLPNHMITLTLNNKISEMMHGSFSGLSLLERPSWSVLQSEVNLRSIFPAAIGGYWRHVVHVARKPSLLWEKKLLLQQH